MPTTLGKPEDARRCQCGGSSFSRDGVVISGHHGDGRRVRAAVPYGPMVCDRCGRAAPEPTDRAAPHLRFHDSPEVQVGGFTAGDTVAMPGRTGNPRLVRGRVAAVNPTRQVIRAQRDDETTQQEYEPRELTHWADVQAVSDTPSSREEMRLQLLTDAYLDAYVGLDWKDRMTSATYYRVNEAMRAALGVAYMRGLL